jgi:hypothetical protein
MNDQFLLDSPINCAWVRMGSCVESYYFLLLTFATGPSRTISEWVDSDRIDS